MYVFFSFLYLIMVVIIIIIIGYVSNGKKKKNLEGLEIRKFEIYYDIAWQCQPSLSYAHLHEVYTIIPPHSDSTRYSVNGLSWSVGRRQSTEICILM